MHMKKILSYCGIGVIILAISVAISVETSQKVFAITTMGIEHSCDLSGEEQMAYEIIKFFLRSPIPMPIQIADRVTYNMNV